MNEVAKINEGALLKINKAKVNNGELALLVLIKKSIEEKKTIELEDVIDIYEKHVQRSKDNNIAWYNEVHKSKQWFFTALGRLCCKEKLMVIPVINIE